MRLRRMSVFAALSMAATAAPSFAQDYDPEDKPFNGLYVAASGGYDVQSSDIGSGLKFDRNGDGNFNDPVTTSNGLNAFSTGFCKGRARDATRSTGCENDRNKASYYGRVGYDRQFGSIVVGVVGEFGKTRIVDYASAYSTTPANYVFSRKVDWESSARVRVGYALQNGLFYATGGGGYARINHGFTSTNTANSFSTLLDDRDRKGFIVGGGVEYRIRKNVSIGMEYTYHDYKDDDYLVRVTRGTAAANNPFVLPPQTSGTTLARTDDNFRWHSLRGVIGFHF